MIKLKPASFFESSARSRIAKLVDDGSFEEFCPPELRRTSPHLARLNAPVAFDDGVAVGSATLAGQRVLIASQEGKFNGGAVGEVHGAKLVGLLERSVREQPAAVLLLVDSGGVRLHEANAGLIAISEIMRAVLQCRAAGVPVIALAGGICGAFGGMGIVSRLCNAIIMSEEGRLGLSGPEVIETVKGVEEFDSRDRPLVWRVTGGKVRRALGEATYLVDDDIASFRSVTAGLLKCYASKPLAPDTVEELAAEHAKLADRAVRFADARDGREIFRASGFSDLDGVALLPALAFNKQLAESI